MRLGTVTETPPATPEAWAGPLVVLSALDPSLVPSIALNSQGAISAGTGQERSTIMKQVMLIAVLGLMLATKAGDAVAQAAGAVIVGTSVEVTKAIALGHRASKLIGAPVYNDRDERVGTIDDLIVAPDRWCRMPSCRSGASSASGGDWWRSQWSKYATSRASSYCPARLKRHSRNSPSSSTSASGLYPAYVCT